MVPFQPLLQGEIGSSIRSKMVSVADSSGIAVNDAEDNFTSQPSSAITPAVRLASWLGLPSPVKIVCLRDSGSVLSRF
jgi:hypothetical protein